ncbi:MAG TPA: prepilin peptidase [candidate division Zixibacteria bacterium]|nr:prepilin peptidase [candidate division Zixibacteria bacterium]
MNDIFYMLALFILGLPIGSFLNVVIWRLPREENIAWPPSHCPKCGEKIRPFDNIPVFSYIILGGKCRNCKDIISIQYPVVELSTAVLFALAWPLTGSQLGWELTSAVIFTAVAIAVTGIDIPHKIIPDELSIGGLAVGLILAPLRAGAWSGLWWAFVSALFGALLLFLVRVGGKAIFKKEALGFGDVKLIAMIGAFVGWRGVLLTIFAGALLGSIGGVIAMAFSKEAREERLIPFGPFLMAGGLVALYFGEGIISWYVTNFWG